MKIYLHKPTKILQFLSRRKIKKCLTSEYFVIFNNKPPGKFSRAFVLWFHGSNECKYTEDGSLNFFTFAKCLISSNKRQASNKCCPLIRAAPIHSQIRISAAV